ncbi:MULTISPECIES: NAD-dependent epimerase/dehydratase family protein [Streptomyces]|uniref:NAD-dependent epimerase/dehydratase family protein n=1 Tax=Streptomyces TaxID=1883 RepID=UPI000A3C2269|nr:NAD(P)H-binding protein [Streptomyces rochei]WDI17157.1 NAD(P)H-binding protein [Streptomyces enissocaesilis]WMI60444.1 NAD(P)H-binding protein [Streptomyces rochei]WQC11545.1 NAD(P)H-binding protein [Streptomyces rochei]
MTRAVVLGATGQIGRVAVGALARDGWEVTAVSRGGGRDAGWPEGVRVVRADREDDAALAAAVGDGCDVLVDMVAFGRAHARQLVSLAGRVGSAVVISSVSVYEDDQGRNFDTQAEPDGFPEYPVPVTENQRTVRPGDASYSTRKAALERDLLAAGDRLPVTLLRAGAIHGPYCRTPRELYFVKRNLDGRRRRVLAYGGASRFHPASVHNIAELIRLAAPRPGTRVLNAVDPEAPTVAEIAAAIDAVMGVETEDVLLDGPPAPGGVGGTPWSVPVPVVCDMTEAGRQLGYRPVVRYAETLPETVAFIEERLAGRDWREAYPKMFENYGDLFDYAAEDAWPAARRA